MSAKKRMKAQDSDQTSRPVHVRVGRGMALSQGGQKCRNVGPILRFYTEHQWRPRQPSGAIVGDGSQSLGENIDGVSTWRRLEGHVGGVIVKLAKTVGHKTPKHNTKMTLASATEKSAFASLETYVNSGPRFALLKVDYPELTQQQ